MPLVFGSMSGSRAVRCGVPLRGEAARRVGLRDGAARRVRLRGGVARRVGLARVGRGAVGWDRGGGAAPWMWEGMYRGWGKAGR